MMTLALLRRMGWPLKKAMQTIQKKDMWWIGPTFTSKR